MMTHQECKPDKSEGSEGCAFFVKPRKAPLLNIMAKKNPTFLKDDDLTLWQGDDTDIDDFVRSFLY